MFAVAPEVETVRGTGRSAERAAWAALAGGGLEEAAGGGLEEAAGEDGEGDAKAVSESYSASGVVPSGVVTGEAMVDEVSVLQPWALRGRDVGARRSEKKKGTDAGECRHRSNTDQRYDAPLLYGAVASGVIVEKEEVWVVTSTGVWRVGADFTVMSTSTAAQTTWHKGAEKNRYCAQDAGLVPALQTKSLIIAAAKVL